MREASALMLLGNKISYAKQNKSKTLVINLLGGPCAGKSKMALLLTGQLKELGIRAEYVSEVAKDYVYDDNINLLDGSMRNQTKILLDQTRRLNRPYFSKMVDIIITDSPLILNVAYNKEATADYTNKVLKLSQCYNNLYFYIKRDGKFDSSGRNQKNLKECIEIDKIILSLLKELNIDYTIIKNNEIQKVLNKIILQGQKKSKKTNKKQKTNKPTTNIKKPQNKQK